MTPVRTLTERRKANLLEQGIGKNSLHASGPKPSGPVFAGFTKGGAPVQNNALGTSLILAGTATALLALTQKSAPRKTGMLSLGASAAIYGLRRFLIKHDGMTIRETGLENPNATIQHLQGMKFEFEVVVRRPARELFSFWRRTANLARIFQRVEYVRSITAFRALLFLRPSLTKRIICEIEIYRERPDELISWRTSNSASPRVAASVEFHTLGRSKTRVVFMITVAPISLAVALRLLGFPSYMEHELHLFRTRAERGQYLHTQAGKMSIA